MIVTFGAGGMSEAFDGVKIPHSECDVRDIAEVASVMDAYRPSVVIVTAGVSHPDSIARGRFEEEISTNLLGAFNVAQIAVNFDVETLIFIASVAGLHGKPNHASYCASKAGVISLVQSLAHEGYNAYAISPGRVDTPMRERDYPSDTPGSRLKPERVWDVVLSILAGEYQPGDNILLRKIGLDYITEYAVPVPFKDELRVGEPVSI